MKNFFVVMLILCLSFIIDGCGHKGSVPEDQNTCLIDADCPEGKICNFGKCSDPQCNSDFECELGQVCSNGRCEIEVKPCETNSDCNSGFKCSEGKCVPAGSCSSDADCNAGYVCDNGQCTPQQTGCSTNLDCPSGYVCDQGQCVAQGGCLSDYDCPSGYVCEAGQCVLSQGNSGTTLCSQQSQSCPSNQSCIIASNGDGLCLNQCGGQQDCANGETCQGILKDQNGQTLYFCYKKCSMDSECTSGMICYQNFLCLPSGWVTQGCQSDADCPGGYVCQNGQCQQAQNQCQSDSDCPSGYVCQSGQCQQSQSQCQSNADCQSGFVCQQGVCVPSQQGGCSIDSDCSGYERCKNGSCVSAVLDGTNYSLCQTNSDCQSGLCVYFSDQIDRGVCLNTCVPSTGQGCGLNETCISLQSGNGGCTTLCSTDTDCPNNLVCVSGKCMFLEQRNVGDQGICGGNNGMCLDNRICVSFSPYTQNGVCMDSCNPQTQGSCQDQTETCITLSSGNGACAKSCDTDQDCPNGLYCYQLSNNQKICVTDAYNGLCYTQDCSTTNCPTGYIGVTTDGNNCFCVEDCTTTDSCSMGGFCYQLPSGNAACIIGCNTSSECNQNIPLCTTGQ